MKGRMRAGAGDKASFRRAAIRTKKENLTHRVVPRGGTRH